tara:strand:+ start:3277 stop:4200 length:924 start_codon:yes stop_codon:yes gene_type:complete
MSVTDHEPFVVDKNLGEKLHLGPDDLPRTNADGEPVIDPTQEQKYLFDARGWLILPGVLDSAVADEMRAHAEVVRDDPESLPEHERNYISGPLEKLTDHPVVVGFLNEFLAHPHLSAHDCYGFRMEGSNVRSPSAEPDKQGRINPHNGGGLFRFANDSHHYQCIPGKAFSGLTRVVWELAPVKHGQGGTLLATGSHKAAYSAPESIQDRHSEVWNTYECPAGSVLFFTEALAHSTCPWTNTENARVGIFNLYNSVGSRWGSWHPPEKLVAQMPPMRQTLFRGTHVADNVTGFRYHGQNQKDRPRAEA